MDVDYIEIIGLCAAVLTTAAFLPQVYQTWKTRDVSGLSLPMLFMFLSGILLWLVFGIFKESFSLILANAITVVSALFLVYFKIKYGKK